MTLIGCTTVPTLTPAPTISPSAVFTTAPVAANFTATPPSVTPSASPTIPATPTETSVPAPQFCTPLEDHTLQDLEEIVTQPFNPPPTGKDTGHHGVDFAYYRRGDRLSIAGVQIQSVLAGKVAAVIIDRIPYGNMIIIETPYDRLPERLVAALEIPARQSLYVLYAHMAAPAMPGPGAEVLCEEVIGEVGSTPKGWSSDPHLHLEGRYGPPGVTFADMDYYDNTAPPEAMANYELWRMSGEFTMVNPLVMIEIGLSTDLQVTAQPPPSFP